MNQEKIFFITDSACDIPAEDEKRLPNLAILPIPVTADGKGYYERESFTAEEFYDLIDRCQDIPATSHIPAITFQEKYEEAYQNGYTHVAVITIYSGASAMYHSALMAKDAFLEEHPDAMQIEVIDSNCYSVGYRPASARWRGRALKMCSPTSATTSDGCASILAPSH